MGKKVYMRDRGSLDGNILAVANTDIGNAETRYTYIDLLGVGYNAFTLIHIIEATTLTIEACNSVVRQGKVVSSEADGTDGSGATIVDSTLSSALGYEGDDDLIGLVVTITADATTPANVGEYRTVTDYVQATGTMTFDAVFGATTSGVTKYKINDSGEAYGPLVGDPTGTEWVDVTDLLTAAATSTATGVWIIDTPVELERIRIKRVTTNATNALRLNLSRGVA